MLSEELKRELVEKKPNPSENIGKLFYRLFRYVQIWHEEKSLENGSYLIKPGLIALLSNISSNGSCNRELAERAFISKQGMSKLLNETLHDGIIEIGKNKNDSRANNIELTDKGAALLVSIWENNKFLIQNFEHHLGKEKTRNLLELLSELSESIKICGKK